MGSGKLLKIAGGGGKADAAMTGITRVAMLFSCGGN
jgi:hypothetical protein